MADDTLTVSLPKMLPCVAVRYNLNTHFLHGWFLLTWLSFCVWRNQKNSPRIRKSVNQILHQLIRFSLIPFLNVQTLQCNCPLNDFKNDISPLNLVMFKSMSLEFLRPDKRQPWFCSIAMSCPVCMQIGHLGIPLCDIEIPISSSTHICWIFLSSEMVFWVPK